MYFSTNIIWYLAQAQYKDKFSLIDGKWPQFQINSTSVTDVYPYYVEGIVTFSGNTKIRKIGCEWAISSQIINSALL